MFEFTTADFSLLLLLAPIHFINVFGLFPYILNKPYILKLFKNKDIFSRLRLANSCCSTYTNGSVALLSVYTVFYDEQTINNPVNGTSPLSRFVLLLSMSFFIYDIIVLSLPLVRHHFFDNHSFEDYKKTNEDFANWETDENSGSNFRLYPIKLLFCREWDDKSPKERYSFLSHHITAFLSFWWILHKNQLLFFGCHRLMAELSTPILNLLFISEKMVKFPPVIADLLKISFSIVFIGCRMFTAPFFWHLAYSTNWIEGVVGPARILNIVSPFMLDILNIYWASKIVYKLVRALRRVEVNLKYD